MSEATDRIKKDWVKRGKWQKGINLLLTLLLVIAITIAIFFYRDRVAELGNYGYLGIFLISLIGNATVLLPIAVLPILCAMSVVLYPVIGPVGPILVGLAGGAGAGIGETTGYMVGCSGQGIVEKVKLYNRLVGWLERWGALAIFILSIVPFFFDLVGIAAGALRFPLWKFILACWLGRTILYVGTVLAAAWGWEATLRYFG